ncbi:MAG: MoxR family ATPase [Chitinispirillales bacterium]|jgi:MoxR-like ATPase|nr:MoxR family ATPase [Chitinispirillales bacterium]
MDITQLNEKIREQSAFISLIRAEIGKVIVGQKDMVDKLLVALLSGGHVLLEGLPGLAKTLAISTLAKVVDTDFKRIQFTPDLLPADLIGTMIFNQKSGDFVAKKGPLFSNFILADEINRAPAKVQSALLEAMQEKQVTIGDTTYKLAEPFLVMATQNPVEQEGTYPLPEAQIDRFMLKVKVSHPNRDEELEILSRMGSGEVPSISKITNEKAIIDARNMIKDIYMDRKVEEYIVDLVFASRQPEKLGIKDLDGLIEYGASPRATLALTKTARSHAFINGRGFVTPEDVKAVGFDVLRHRIVPTYEAEAENVTSEDIVRKIFDSVLVP